MRDLATTTAQERIDQAARIAQAEAARVLKADAAKQQKAHGDRVAARHAVNGQPFADAGQQHVNGFAVGTTEEQRARAYDNRTEVGRVRTLADRTAEHKAAGFAPGLGTETEGH